ncbi:MAG: glycosyltransferase family 39 protein, partial [Pseudomonadota bacterium]
MSFFKSDQDAGQQPIALLWIWVLAAAWILPGLAGHDPWKPDEAYTFGLVYSLLQNGDWVVPMLAHEPFVEKPPLFYLSAAAIASILSPPFALHDAARLTTGLYMALTFAFIAGAAREIYGTNRGWLAALMLMGCVGILIRSHQLITDIPLLTGFAAGFYGLALALRRPTLGGFWLGTGVGIGFIVTKIHDKPAENAKGATKGGKKAAKSEGAGASAAASATTTATTANAA